MKIYNSVSELIGNTPLVRFGKYAQSKGIGAEILAKLEYLNPAGSAKDRVGKEMIDSAVKSGKISKGSVIIEPTSGNTGIGIASYATQLGMRVIIVMPETMSIERRRILSAYGAELVLTDGEKGMKGSVEKAEEIAASIPGSFIPAQFDNPDNTAAHYKTTGPEIWKDTDGRVDILVAGVGTGGTITGTGKFLKEKNPGIKVVAVEPSDSPLLSGGKAGPHSIQGIGANFIPSVLDTDIYDEIVTVSTDEAYSTAKEIVKTEGIIVGASAAAAVYAAAKIGSKPENAGKNIVVILPDSGEKYLSTGMFENE